LVLDNVAAIQAAIQKCKDSQTDAQKLAACVKAFESLFIAATNAYKVALTTLKHDIALLVSDGVFARRLRTERQSCSDTEKTYHEALKNFRDCLGCTNIKLKGD